MTATDSITTELVLNPVDEWISVLLKVLAEEVNRNQARPTVISRMVYITVASMYQAWSAYDDAAVGTELGHEFRRPNEERTEGNKAAAIGYAAARAMRSIFTHSHQLIHASMVKHGLDPSNDSTDPSTAGGVGNVAAMAVLMGRQDDASNYQNDYADYTDYQPINSVDHIRDPNRWQEVEFTMPDGSKKTPAYLTPHWGQVKSFALRTPDQFRSPPPPQVGDPKLKEEVDEVVNENASLTPEKKAIVEYMRDGPNSTSQSGQWLEWAQRVSRRDAHGLDRDIKMYFCLAAVGLDAFIASWETKRAYDSARPRTLIAHFYGGKQIQGWGGPGKGTVALDGADWKPYSPADFITPPFPGMVSGHSTVSAASARTLELFTGADHFGTEDVWRVGSLTEPGQACQGADCTVLIRLPTFTATAELAGISRVYGGFHIQSDNVNGLVMGRQIAMHHWPIVQSYFNGTYVHPARGEELKVTMVAT